MAQPDPSVERTPLAWPIPLLSFMFRCVGEAGGGPFMSNVRQHTGMDAYSLKQLILTNGAEITRLRACIDETLAGRSAGAQGRDDWKNACAQFHGRYDELAFPGGYAGAADRILAGDPYAMEAAVCFLECRPYFFRSGYMYKELLRKAKRAPFSQEQNGRLKVVLERVEAWRAFRRAERAA
jgi:hypothetical protein